MTVWGNARLPIMSKSSCEAAKRTDIRMRLLFVMLLWILLFPISLGNHPHPSLTICLNNQIRLSTTKKSLPSFLRASNRKKMTLLVKHGIRATYAKSICHRLLLRNKRLRLKSGIHFICIILISAICKIQLFVILGLHCFLFSPSKTNPWYRPFLLHPTTHHPCGWTQSECFFP